MQDTRGKRRLRARRREPGSSGIAKAFAAVFAPCARSQPNVAPLELELTPFGRPAGFARDAPRQFASQRRFPFEPRRIAQPHPDEVKDFVRENARVLGCLCAQCFIEDDQTPANESGGVRRITRGIAKPRAIANFDGGATEYEVIARVR